MNGQPDIIQPPAVKRGGTIGLVSPSGPVQDMDLVHAGIHLLHEAGFRTKFNRDFRCSVEGYLAGSDAERCCEFNELWADPEVDAILAVRGGYGALRIIDALDMDMIRSTPKPFIGFSDITVLLTAIFQMTGLLTFHGPVLTTLSRSDKKSVLAFFETITGTMPASIKPRQLEIIKPGNGRGRLLGGNLSTLIHLIGTPFDIPLAGRILFLEDVGEQPYRIDRMLTHLKKAGRLDDLAGLILGTFAADQQTDHRSRVDDEPVWQRVLELTDGMPYPVWANFPCGHGTANHILPIGALTEMNSSSGVLHFQEPSTTRAA